MKRHAEAELSSWFNENERMPLVIRGARQVGKSTLVRNFCIENKIELLEVNLEKKKLSSLDQSNINVNEIIEEIEARTGVEVAFDKKEKKQLIFIDEIQAQEKGLMALRYFYEEKASLAVVAAGSLLEFMLNENPSGVPVGRISYLKLGPMCFSEFLLALDEKLLLKNLLTLKELNVSLHQKALDLYKKYIIVGGMPKAVLSYSQKKSLLSVRKIQKDLIETFKDDFLKYTKKSRQINHVHKVFDWVPYHLGQKVKYSEIVPEAKSLDVKKAIDLLILARLLLPVNHTNAAGIPLSAQKDDRIFKLFFLDVGLVCASVDLDLETINESSLFDGMLAEQFVAQHLAYRQHEPVHSEVYYWMKDKSTAKAEIDFLLQYGKNIIPIEVKSGTLGKLRSLNQFCVEKKSPFGVVISPHPLKIKQNYQYQMFNGTNMSYHKGCLLELPLYLVEKLKELFERKRDASSNHNLD